MDKWLQSYDFTFLFDIRTSCKIKMIDLHIVKPWITYITVNNIFALWDYSRKICLKTFNTSILDPNSNDNLIVSLTSKSTEIRNLRFLDKETIFWQFPTSQPYPLKDIETMKNFNKNWIIFHNEQKIIFYDYVTDQTEILGQLAMENKTIKTVNVLDFNFIAVGCGDGSIKIFNIANWNFIKTLKGYHIKPINFVTVFQDIAGGKGKMIGSSQDGLIACWSSESEIPICKFLMIKKGKPVKKMEIK